MRCPTSHTKQATPLICLPRSLGHDQSNPTTQKARNAGKCAPTANHHLRASLLRSESGWPLPQGPSPRPSTHSVAAHDATADAAICSPPKVTDRKFSSHRAGSINNRRKSTSAVAERLKRAYLWSRLTRTRSRGLRRGPTDPDFGTYHCHH